MINTTKSYDKDNGIQSLVMGVSGGLDSATVAAILQEYNTTVPLIGLSMPMSSSNEHKERAQWVGENYCTAFEEFVGWEGAVVDPDAITYRDFHDILSQTDSVARRAGCSVVADEVRQGNMKARLRMITLYDLARKTNGMVLSTDNLSEYMAGFWTICGDVGDWGIIQNVWKGFELPQIARHIGVREDIITQKPSDGLSVTEHDTDEAQLGVTYQEFDTIIGIYTNRIETDPVMRENLRIRLQIIIDNPDNPDNEKVVGAIARYEGTEFKRQGTYNLPRAMLFDWA